CYETSTLCTGGGFQKLIIQRNGKVTSINSQEEDLHTLSSWGLQIPETADAKQRSPRLQPDWKK
ncbi:Hypothetical predicted protein, partial [Pelobates cultripes]